MNTALKFKVFADKTTLLEQNYIKLLQKIKGYAY